VVSQTVGYATDVPYLRTFFHELAPAWLDLVAVVSGFVPPARDGGFAFCDLGCGQGVTTAILAATHPKGNFYGIDAMPSHIEHAHRFAAEGTIANINFYAVDFETATSLDLPGFDYIVAHGVYSWVNAESQAALRVFIDRHLKPGGLVYISYNAVPGRTADQPFQRLVRELGGSFKGNSTARYRAAAKIVHTIADLKPPALAASPFLKELRKNKKRFSEAYLVHELMTENWQPLSVTEVRSAMASIGLAPVGSATMIENFDSLVLRRAARKALGTISDADARELARDFLINQFFRRDVFVRAGRRLDQKDRRRRLRETTFSLSRPRRAIKYTTVTPAGRLKYGNAVARSIVSVLSASPASLAEVVTRSNLADQDVLANVLVLCAAGAVWPVESHAVSVSALNQAIRRRLGGSEEIRYLALPCGTALEIEDACRGLLDGKRRKVAGKHGDWLKFLASHNLSPDEMGKA
jgi:SAM-dependent methyltransferase